MKIIVKMKYVYLLNSYTEKSLIQCGISHFNEAYFPIYNSFYCTNMTIITSILFIFLQTTDHHTYYKSRIFSDPNGAYWNELHGHTRHSLSNDKHLVYSVRIYMGSYSLLTFL